MYFDRMILLSDEILDENHTNDFQHAIVIPKVNFEYIFI